MIEEQLQELQIAFMHQEETIERLSSELHIQQQENRHILERLSYLEKRMQSISPSLIASQSEETPPPHY